jgi:hypothetical protein
MTVTLDAETSELVDIGARQVGLSRSEFVRRQLWRALEQFRPHPKPRSAGIIKRSLRERGEESELFRYIER